MSRPHAFAASTALSRGVNGKPGVRHAPTLINRAWGKSQFWDGRAPTLESQVIVPVTNPDEMGMTVDKWSNGCAASKATPHCLPPPSATARSPSSESPKRIATFERTIVSGNSAYDRYLAR